MFVCIVITSEAQQTRFRVTHYDETSGLQSGSINTIMQDSKGYMWFGTADGLYRYDGYSFKAFRKEKRNNSLPDNNVVKLAEDHDGKIWAGLLNNISSYDPATGIFMNYDVSNIDTASPVNGITMLFIDKANNVWAGLSQQGLIRLDKIKKTFKQYDIVIKMLICFSNRIKTKYSVAG